MKATTNPNSTLSFQQLTDLVLQLPKIEREKLASVLQEEIRRDKEPLKSKILDEIKQDLVALKKGTLKTRPIKDVLNEL
ncbi:hypothetical protein [Dyadobacter sp. CY323]|uniref:hypothetical protein n=1 Tax=Dyadobacter sp. CY323 TaxID=2907302 RepID=UPI001F2A37E7|nr:hypothetical protein [Dyadobacter sp. CY323]MCE6990385.1 hypothetical protein [Dyadobacter sp. CY323]